MRFESMEDARKACIDGKFFIIQYWEPSVGPCCANGPAVKGVYDNADEAVKVAEDIVRPLLEEEGIIVEVYKGSLNAMGNFIEEEEVAVFTTKDPMAEEFE